MYGYDLADEVFHNIGLNENHEISLDDAIRVISFWGYNEEANIANGIGFVCYCARLRIKKTFEQALVYDDFTLFDEMAKKMQEVKGMSLEDKINLSYYEKQESEE